jgi:hypothetical protein
LPQSRNERLLFKQESGKLPEWLPYSIPVCPRNSKKAVTKIEKQIVDKSSGPVIAASGLSVGVDGMEGPIAEGEPSRCREFGASIARGL